MNLILLFFTVILQNASFTLVSRARNSGSYWYNAGASVFSNGIWFIVIAQIITKPNDVATGAVYIVAATIGSVLMQWVAINYLEKKKVKPKPEPYGVTLTLDEKPMLWKDLPSLQQDADDYERDQHKRTHGLAVGDDGINEPIIVSNDTMEIKVVKSRSPLSGRTYTATGALQAKLGDGPLGPMGDEGIHGDPVK